MKMHVLLLTALLLPAVAMGQDIPSREVPSAVINAIKAKFPNTTGLEWEKKGDLFEAEFDVNQVDHKALLEPGGKLLMYKRDIRAADLPQAVKRTIRKQYPNFRIDDVEKLEKEGAIFYQVELDGKPHDQKLVIRADGKVDSEQQYWD